jgi:hypothetical protein
MNGLKLIPIVPGSFCCICGTTEEAAEKGLGWTENPEKHTPGAEAHADSIGLLPGINPPPTARLSFSAAWEVVPFQNIKL